VSETIETRTEAQKSEADMTHLATTDTYWHFAACDADGTPRLAYGDGRKIRVGETLAVEGEPVLCEHGRSA
jgi:hypothetical protein